MHGLRFELKERNQAANGVGGRRLRGRLGAEEVFEGDAEGIGESKGCKIIVRGWVDGLTMNVLIHDAEFVP